METKNPLFWVFLVLADLLLIYPSILAMEIGGLWMVIAVVLIYDWLLGLVTVRLFAKIWSPVEATMVAVVNLFVLINVLTIVLDVVIVLAVAGGYTLVVSNLVTAFFFTILVTFIWSRVLG